MYIKNRQCKIKQKIAAVADYVNTKQHTFQKKILPGMKKNFP